MKYSLINMRRIGQAIEYYEELGYEYIDTPWIVTLQNINKTLPKGKKAVELKDRSHPSKYLVGSAEQGFLQIYRDLEPNKRYVSSSPCFRQEDQYSDLHRFYFYKVELFIKEPTTSLSDVYSDALLFFKEYFDNDCLKIVKTSSNSCDIFYYNPEDDRMEQIELGTYSRLTYTDPNTNKTQRWICGTGLAEPRFSYALSQY